MTNSRAAPPAGSGGGRLRCHRLWSGAVLLAVWPALIALQGGVGDFLPAAEGLWAYAFVFLLAAIPWWEVLLVVPPAVGLGLNPVLVGVLAFLGNATPIYLIVAVHGRVTHWVERRRGEDEEPAARTQRARRIFEQYGLGTLALIAPVAVGIHLATVVALLLGAPPRKVAAWMTASIAVWTVALVAASVVGFDLLGIA